VLLAWSSAAAPLAAQPLVPVGQPSIPISTDKVVVEEEEGPLEDGNVTQAGCSSCGHGQVGHGHGHHGGCASCGHGGWCCYPGLRPCGCDHENYHGLRRCLCEFYHCICCPDPCYEPAWIGVANAALFVESVRPVTQIMLRYDGAREGVLPDRAEYFWARTTNPRTGKGPKPRPGTTALGEIGFDYDELTFITETATPNGKFSFAVEIPYRHVSPLAFEAGSGFGDLRLATKSMLLDCELMQLAFGFRTFLPTGNPGKGVGTGHLSFEIGLLTAIKLTPSTYFQGQLSEWIPIQGDSTYAGAILHYHFSLNQIICQICPDLHLIGTAEFNAWSFQDGAYTDPVLGTRLANEDTYISVGPGVRLVFCDKIDFGFGAAFNTENANWYDQLYRVEFRWRF
jgi:hypothetical protein